MGSSASQIPKPAKTKPPLADRLFFGGNLGLSFGDVTHIDISPLIGYKLTPQLIAGLGITYQYFQDNNYTPVYKNNVYGGRLFGRYYTRIRVFLHTEYETLRYDDYYDPSRKITENNIYVGGGYTQAIGGRAGFEILFLYNLNESPYSLYSNPIFRMGVGIGI
jgi:hypothetical protein